MHVKPYDAHRPLYHNSTYARASNRGGSDECTIDLFFRGVNRFTHAQEWEWGVGRYHDFSKLTQPCLDRGIMNTTMVDEATLSLMKLKVLIDLYVEYLE